MLRGESVQPVSSGFTLNIIALGTNQHRDKSQTLLTVLYDYLATDQANQYNYIIDGPGGLPSSPSEHPALGKYAFSCHLDPKTNQIKTEKKIGDLYALEGPAIQIGGLVAGAGCDDGIMEIMAVVDVLVRENKTPLTINFFGFSRGADLILRASNILNSLYTKEIIKVNLFAIDPVPGPVRREDKVSTLIPSIVDHAVFTYMENDQLPVLVPVTKTEHTKEGDTIVDYRIIKGTHCSGQLMESHPGEGETLLDASKILWATLQEFADQHGVQTKKDEKIPYVSCVKGDYRVTKDEDFRKSQKQQLNFYTQMILDSSSYERAAGKLGKKRKFRKKDYFLHGTDFFQDLYHLNLFKTLYPHYFDYFFQANKGGSIPQDVLADAIKICSDEKLKSLLESREYPVRIGTHPFPNPRGIPVLFDELYQNHEIMRLWEGFETACFAVRRKIDLFSSDRGFVGGIETACLAVRGDVEVDVYSADRRKAKKLLADIRSIISLDSDEGIKIRKIEKKISEIISENLGKKPGLFLFKLIALLGVDKLTFYFAKATLKRLRIKHANNLHIVEEINTHINKLNNILASGEIDRAIVTQQLRDFMEEFRDILRKEKINDSLDDFFKYDLSHFGLIDLGINYLNNYLNEKNPKNFDLKKSKHSVAKIVLGFLERLRNLNAQNDTQAIRYMLNRALLAIGKINQEKAKKCSKKQKINSKFEDLIREIILNIASFKSPINLQNSEDVKDLLRAFDKKLSCMLEEEVDDVSAKEKEMEKEKGKESRGLSFFGGDLVKGAAYGMKKTVEVSTQQVSNSVTSTITSLTVNTSNLFNISNNPLNTTFNPKSSASKPKPKPTPTPKLIPTKGIPLPFVHKGK